MAIIIDTECYKNYWLFAALNTKTGNKRLVDSFNNSPLDLELIRDTMNRETISFNGLSYDLPMITAALSGWSNQALYKLSTDIIKSGLPSWQIVKRNNLKSLNYNHIDLIEVAIGQASLKIYAGRLNAPKMQDLPIDVSKEITEEERDQLRGYCINDLDNTALLYKELEGKIDLRRSMSKQYHIDLRSKSDAQIAEAIIKSELKNITGIDYRPKEYPANYTFKYRDPKHVEFQTEQLQTLFNKLLAEDFELAANKSVQMPDWLKKTKINIGNSVYQMGIGGLHSTEKSQCVIAGDYCIADFDVTSYYPSIIIQQKLAPESMGTHFLQLYKGIVSQRIFAKKKVKELEYKINELGDVIELDKLKKEKRMYEVEEASKKISLNGSFGKFGSPYSALYSPELLLQTTLTGQLSLLMLIETLELNGIKVVSANTDGIVTYYRFDQLDLLQELLWDWMLQTSYNLERTDYRLLASRDVNNYLAVKTNGEVKGKGIFTKASIGKNPDGQIIYEAVINNLSKDVPLDETFYQCKDITKFATVRRVDGGAIWNEQYLGKAIRFYHSSAVDKETCIHYAKNSNRVPNSGGCRPLMDLPNTFPDDIDYDYYIQKARELKQEIGYDMC